MRPGSVIALLALAVGVVVLWSLSTGPIAIPAQRTYGIVWRWVTDGFGVPPAGEAMVVVMLRLPRIILACLTGAALAVSGTALQATLRNPLVSPYLLGVSSGAAFGASLVLLSPAAGTHVFVQLAAFAGAMTAVTLVWLIGKRDASRSQLVIVLAGVVIGSCFSAATMVVQYVSEADRLQAIVFWTMGGFSAARWADVVACGPTVVLGCAVTVLLAWRLNVLSLGTDEARALGVNPNTSGWFVIGVASLMTAATVAVCGPIGWVGLIAPHAARRMVGVNNVLVVPCAGLLGAIALTAMDVLGRVLLPSELPVGILTALVGGPLFVVLLTRQGRAPWRT